MEALKVLYYLKDNFEDKWFARQYALHKNVPETEKLIKLSGIRTLLLRSCPNPDELKRSLNEGNRSSFMMYSPHVSLQEYVQYYGRDDGRHWNSKVLDSSGDCVSYYPTIEMLRETNWLAVFPRNYLVRYKGYDLLMEQLIGELFDWKNEV